ncbi:MAG: hypothetical protein HOP19_03370 [Acidobacteria bacterium]|nr:hypothetical protein [Acidobacteriota bacterium]
MQARIHSVLLLLVLTSCLTQAQSQPATVTTALSKADSSNLLERTFDQVWRTVKDKHFDPTLGGVNWDQVRVRYAARLAKIKTEAELYPLLQQMLGELHQSHFQVISPAAVVTDDEMPSGTATTGIELQVLGTQAVISAVEPNSSAAQTGLRPGYVITKAGAHTVAGLAQKLTRSTETAAIKRLRLERLVIARLKGEAGKSVTVQYLNEKLRPQTAQLELQPYQGEWSAAFGNFGPQPMRFESKRLANGIGYIRFNIWVTPMMAKLRAALKDFEGMPGLIIDLRVNPGGVGGMANGLSGYLLDKEASLGKMQMRSGYQNFHVTPQKNAATPIFTGPLVILQDYGSASTSEVFAAGLQDLNRAVVIGERSAGAALPSFIEKLPKGGLFQYAIGDFKTSKGTLIEGRGVVPNLVAPPTRASLLAGRDLALEAALRHIASLPKARATVTK